MMSELGPVPLNELQLTAWGERVGALIDVPAVLALRGELGAGKSVFARAVARGAGVHGPLPSPTFNLVFVYQGARGVDVYHLDLYRLEHSAEVWELGWRELGDGPEIVLIEWPERAEALLPEDRWDIYLEKPGSGSGSGSDSDVRVVRAVRRGEAPELPRP
ncbi:MAG: tRNA (adenosine(37)-N6)-threonylcarbamoyltransferase complex ATPase subunit type 1 TsaE [Gemmatimonadetes bacterium]|nr:tRNA (adenosine(37)-N6)-threonylcarbamoyltransferase complex ATPase subunit type 1 TsaE [Gemmatimonadota bacterium]